MIDERKIQAWGQQTVPDATAQSVLLHMSEELQELYDTLKRASLRFNLRYIGFDGKRVGDFTQADIDHIHEEIGDVGILLVHLAGMVGTNLTRCINEKFEIASQRRYEYDPVRGYAKHVEEINDATERPDHS